MALPALATVEELADWLGTSIDNEARATAILAASSTLVRSYSGRTWVDEDGEEEDLTEVQQHAAKIVVLSVASRVWRNPHGTTQEALGSFSHSVAAWAAHGLALTEDEQNLISVRAGGIAGLTSIRVEAPVAASGSRFYEWWEADEEA